MNESTKLWNKNVNDLTVGDALKINAYAVAIPVAVYAVVWTGVVAKNKVTDWRLKRKAEKQSMITN